MNTRPTRITSISTVFQQRVQANGKENNQDISEAYLTKLSLSKIRTQISNWTRGIISMQEIYLSIYSFNKVSPISLHFHWLEQGIKHGHQSRCNMYLDIWGHWMKKASYSISQEICKRFLLCCALLWLCIDWFSHIHQAYFTGTVAI